MACLQVADNEGILQIWQVAANILNKQSWTDDRRWFSSLGVGWRASNSPYKVCYRWIDYVARPKLWKTDMRLIRVYEVRCNESTEDYIFRHSVRSQKMSALCGDHVHPSTHDVFVRFLWNSMHRLYRKSFIKKNGSV